MPYQLLPLHDPHSRPADWNQRLTQSQCAVFLCDARNGIALTPDGGPPPAGERLTCLVFESLDEATAFCQQKIHELPHLRCDLYDHRGNAAGALRTFVGADGRHRLPTRRTARWMRLGALLLLLACPFFFWWDIRNRGGLVIPTFLGLNCIIAGLRLLYMAHVTVRAAKQYEKP